MSKENNKKLKGYNELKEFYNLDKDKIFLITVKALIVDDNNVLVVKGSVGRKLWGLPGGLLEYGESLDVGLKREVKEEVNLKIENLGLHNVSSVYRDKKFLFKDGRKYNARIIEISYLCKKLSADIKFDWEIEDSAWVTKNNYQQYEIYPTSLEALEKYFNNN